MLWAIWFGRLCLAGIFIEWGLRNMRIFSMATAIALLSASVMGVGVARAQDYSEPATYGDYTISAAGQAHEVEVVAGGLTNAADLGNGCVGQIATAPDVQLDLQSGGAPLRLSVDSDFDSTLVVNSATGEWLCDDDSAGNLNAALNIASPTTGTYDIWVGAYDEGANFSSATLTISQGQVTSAPTVASTPTGVDRLERGMLEAGDETREFGEYQDVYTYDASVGESVVFDVRSEDFDTYLQIFAPSGEEFYNDDYEGDTSRSLVSLTPEENGQYRVVVSSFFSDETGPYT